MCADRNLAFKIGDRLVGISHPVFVIAEAGVNHNGDIALARQLVDVAADAGADAVKFQTFKAEAVVTREAPKADYQLQTTDNDESQFEMLKRLELTEAAHLELQAYCDRKGVMFLSTPFDEAAADFLESINVPAFKVSSGDLTNHPLLEHIGRFNKPLILSTGMSTLEEVGEAIASLPTSDLIVLHCVSNYPADPTEINLRALKTMRDEFNLPVGFSDHSQGNEVAMAAVGLGACVIEKHFTLSRSLPGPDHQASLEPDELRALVSGVRKVEQALGDGKKRPTASELATAKIARRSLIAATTITSGTEITRQHIILKRPGTGLSPAKLKIVLGKKARVDIPEGSFLSMELLD